MVPGAGLLLRGNRKTFYVMKNYSKNSSQNSVVRIIKIK